MTEIATMPTTQPIVKLIGADSNAFMILGLCRRAARKAGWTEAQTTAVFAEMTGGNYDQLLGAAMKYFDVR